VQIWQNENTALRGPKIEKEFSKADAQESNKLWVLFCGIKSEFTVNTTREEFEKGSENAALFLRLGLPSTPIQTENGAFTKTLLKQEEFENAGCFSGRKTI